jgi:hypothetical protein
VDTLTGLTASTKYYVNVFTRDYRSVFGTNTSASRDTCTTTAQNQAPSPQITISANSHAFGNQTINTTSSEWTYTVSGANLSPSSGNITITPPSGYEVSKTTSTGFGSSITFAYTSGTLGTSTVYTHFVPTAVQSYAGNVTNTGGGGTTQNVAVTGSGIAVASIALIDTLSFQIEWDSLATINTTINGSTTYAIFIADGHLGGAEVTADSVKIGTTKMVKADNGGPLSFYTLHNPPTSTQTITAFFHGKENISGVFLTYSGVSSVGAFSISDMIYGNTALPVNIASTSGDLVISAAIFAEIGTPTMGDGQTKVIRKTFVGEEYINVQVDSKSATTTTTTMSETYSIEATGVIGGLALKP